MRRSGRKGSQKMVRSMSTTGCTVEALLVPCTQHRDRQPPAQLSSPSICNPSRAAHGIGIALVQVHQCMSGDGRSLTRNMEAITRAPCKARRISGLQQGEHFLGHLGLAGASVYRHA